MYPASHPTHPPVELGDAVVAEGQVRGVCGIRAAYMSRAGIQPGLKLLSAMHFHDPPSRVEAIALASARAWVPKNA